MTVQTKNKPTESEMEILQVLWEKGQCTVREVHDFLSQSKETGYTTTLKQMQIMLDRGFVSRDTSPRMHLYTASILQKQVQEQMLDKIINTVYSGSATNLVMQALGNYSASEEEMEMIEKFINGLKKK